MKQKLSLFITLCFVFLLVSHDAWADFEFLDGKIRIKGRLEQFMILKVNIPHEDRWAHKHNIGVNQSIFAIEGLFNLVNNDTLLINLQSYFRWYYDSVTDLDHRYRDSFDRRYLNRRIKTNRWDADDWVNELYLDAYSGPWNIRLGKQVIAWSEVEMVRTIDRINPLDMRYSTPGIEPFEEIKMGLWMLRLFYNSDLPGNLIFETIFVPGDHERSRVAVEGTWMMDPPAPGDFRGPGMRGVLDQWWDRCEVPFSLKNYKFAFRIRGNSEVWLFKTPYVLDWTLSYINTLDDSLAVTDDWDLANEYLTSIAVDRVTGEKTFKSERERYFAILLGKIPGPIPSKRIWHFRRYELIGGSLQTYVPPLGSVLRGEISFELGRNWNKIDPRTAVRNVGNAGPYAPGITERNMINYGITLDRPLFIPWYGNRMQRWGVRPAWDVTLGFFQGYYLGNVSRTWRVSDGYGDRSQTFFTFMLRGGFRHNEFIPVIRAQYNTRNFGYVSPAITYMPGKHLRFETGFLWFWAANDPEAHREAKGEDLDALFFKIRYEY